MSPRRSSAEKERGGADRAGVDERVAVVAAHDVDVAARGVDQLDAGDVRRELREVGHQVATTTAEAAPPSSPAQASANAPASARRRAGQRDQRRGAERARLRRQLQRRRPSTPAARATAASAPAPPRAGGSRPAAASAAASARAIASRVAARAPRRTPAPAPAAGRAASLRARWRRSRARRRAPPPRRRAAPVVERRAAAGESAREQRRRHLRRAHERAVGAPFGDERHAFGERVEPAGQPVGEHERRPAHAVVDRHFAHRRRRQRVGEQARAGAGGALAHEAAVVVLVGRVAAVGGAEHDRGALAVPLRRRRRQRAVDERAVAGDERQRAQAIHAGRRAGLPAQRAGAIAAPGATVSAAAPVITTSVAPYPPHGEGCTVYAMVRSASIRKWSNAIAALSSLVAWVAPGASGPKR